MTLSSRSLTIAPVASRRDQKTFLQMPWRFHSGDPNWTPPLRMVQKELVGFARHPFYDTAESQAFLAFRGSEPVGRILAILNRAHNERFQEQRGFFGFFECREDQEAASGLFDAARAWLAERKIHQFRGPVNPSLNYEVGLLIEGFDSPATFMMTYNPPYYQQLIEAYGFVKSQDLYAFWGHSRMIEGLDPKLMFIAEEAARRFGVTVRQLDTRRFKEEVRMFLQIYNESLVGTWGFVPLSAGEINQMSTALRYLIIPEITSIAEVNGKPVGVAFGMLDYNPLIKQIDGRLFPTGFLRLLWGRKRIQKIRLIAANVIQEYQRWGLGLVLLKRMVPDVLAWGVKEAEFSWVLESNHLSRASLERGGAQRAKTYRVYDYPAPHPES